MMVRHAVLVMLLLGFLGSPPAFALPDWSVSLLPATGEIAGAPGSTIGWGYSITNLDTTAWLSLSGLSADPFANGTVLSLFDFPTLAPGQSVTVPFVADTQGLFQLTWDLTAPVGAVNTGTFLLGGEWYASDPFAGGEFLDFALDRNALYMATVTAPPANPVAEPSTLLLLASGLVGLGGMGRRREW
jgi:hypothetical protein